MIRNTIYDEIFSDGVVIAAVEKDNFGRSFFTLKQKRGEADFTVVKITVFGRFEKLAAEYLRCGQHMRIYGLKRKDNDGSQYIQATKLIWSPLPLCG